MLLIATREVDKDWRAEQSPSPAFPCLRLPLPLLFQAQVAILQAELAAAEERARQAEDMLEAVHRSALDAGGARSENSSPLPQGGQPRGHSAASWLYRR